MLDLLRQAAGSLRRWAARLPAGGDGEGRRRTYTDGEIIHRPGDPAHALVLVESGRVRLSVGSSERRRKTVAYAEAGQVFGEGVLTGGPRRTEFAVAERTDSTASITVVEILREDLESAADREPAVLHDLLAMVGRRLEDARGELASLAYDTVRERILRTLLRLAEQRCGPGPSDPAATVSIDITHARLAMAVGAARETVSSDVEDLEREGVLQTRRGRLSIVPERLRRSLTRAADGRAGHVVPDRPTVTAVPSPALAVG